MVNSTLLDHNKRHVAVIGGGMAGISAAVHLANQGVQVSLFEASSQLGGRARSVAIEVNSQVHELDNGQHILLGAYRETLKLLDTIGIAESDALMRLPLKLDIRKGHQTAFKLASAHVLPKPFNHIVGFLNCQGFSIGESWSVLRFILRMKRAQYQIPQDKTLSSFLKKQQQSINSITLLWEPLCLAALNTPVHLASARVFLKVLHDSFEQAKSDSDLLLPKRDLSQIFAHPVSHFLREHHANIVLNQRIKLIKSNSRGYTIYTKNSKLEVSHVIVGASPARIGNMLSELPLLNTAIEQTSQYDYQPIYTIYLQYPSHIQLSSPMLGLTESLSQWVFDRGLLCGQHGLMAVIISAKGKHQTLTQEALALTVAKELHACFPQLEKPLWHKVIAEKRATFSCTVNLARPAQMSPYPHLYLAGDYTYADYPATIEGAVRSGLNCAQLVLNS
jgi:squalene-associated FAD-dependent desaturase